MHNTTVSLALSNSASIAEATRKRIQSLAAEMGYYPDPALRALIAYRRDRMTNRARETIAFLTNGETRCDWRASIAHENTYAGARRKIDEMGYQLEHFWLGEPGLTPLRLSNVLYHRGITGALIGFSRATDDDLSDIDWSRLSAIKLGCHPSAPMLHRVTADCGGMAQLAVRRIVSAGFKRIGLVVSDRWDELSDRAWSAGFLAAQSQLAPADRIPVLHHGSSREDWDSRPVVPDDSSGLGGLAAWYREFSPEVIVGFAPVVLSQLRRLGLSAPRDVGYIELGLERPDFAVAGVQANWGTVGEVAATLLVAQLQQNLRGIPPVATTTSVGGTWVDGESLPATPATEGGARRGCVNGGVPVAV